MSALAHKRKAAAVEALMRVVLDPTPVDVSMRQHEVEIGGALVLPGLCPWLPNDDWLEAVVSKKGGRVRIVLIVARKPGTGAFRRLVDGILAAGLMPVVVTPLWQMEAIMLRWGWIKSTTGTTFADREETWRPPAGWRHG